MAVSKIDQSSFVSTLSLLSDLLMLRQAGFALAWVLSWIVTAAKTLGLLSAMGWLRGGFCASTDVFVHLLSGEWGGASWCGWRLGR